MKCFQFMLVFLVVALISCSSNSNQEAKYPHYDLSLHVNPSTKEITVTGQLHLPYSLIAGDSTFLYLQRNMDIKAFSVNGENIARIDSAQSDYRFMPQARKIYLNSTGITKPITTIDIDYRGKLADLPPLFPNRITPDWTEIGLYYPWFPYNPKLYRLMTYDINIQNQSDYQIFGIGKIKQSQQDISISSRIPTNDIVICMTDTMSNYKSPLGNNTLQIFHQQFPETMLDSLAESIGHIHQRYEKWFGKKNSDITLIDSKRQQGGGYARLGGLVLSGIQPEKYQQNITGYIRYFAHEVAHLWWFRAQVNSWQDWLNESFAEYSALLVLRAEFGEQAFQSRLAKKQENLDGTPPIWGLDRNSAKHKIVHAVLYNKGPILLNKLENKIGTKNFFNLCYQIDRNQLETTDAFLAQLAALSNSDTANWFEQLLKTY